MPSNAAEIWAKIRRAALIGQRQLRRGPASHAGTAARAAARWLDGAYGPWLRPDELRSKGPAMVRDIGPRRTAAAFLRYLGWRFKPPRLHRNPVNRDLRRNVEAYHHTAELTTPDGVVPARRPKNELDFALETPFGFDPAPSRTGPLAAIVHAFHIEELPGVLKCLAGVPGQVDLFLTTDVEDKRARLADATAGWRKGSVEIRLTPNRGRDVAAKLVGFADVYERYDLFLHLHLKKSPHGGAALARWRDYLVDTLVGSPEIAASNLSLFDDPRVGVVFPQHLFELRGVLNWGYDFPIARALMARMGVTIDTGMVLEFPSGSMFFARSAALRPLLALGLAFEDFPEESGQIDGTLAHAVERIVLMTAETAGFEWRKVARADLYPLRETVLACRAPEDLARHRLKVFQPILSPIGEPAPIFALPIAERRPIAGYPCACPRPRLNLLVPTVNPHQSFGGVSTALRLFDAWAERLGPGVDRRIVSTDADIKKSGYAAFPDYVAQPFLPPLEPPARALVDASEREGGRLDLRARDVFVATAWWSADIIEALEADRRRWFGGARSYVYLIQDDETHFYGRGAKSSLAEETYRSGRGALAIFNSEELHAAMTGAHAFDRAFVLPFQIDPRIEAALRRAPREREILVYGRPSVSRNAFETICAGLQIWQRRDPVRASRWRITFLGEAFAPRVVAPLQNARVEGKLTLDDYAARLCRASVGLSLMLSPHPSYPPLEMAMAGMITVVNAFAGRDPRDRIPDPVVVGSLRPDEVARAVEEAVRRAEPLVGQVTGPDALRPPRRSGRVADVDAIAAELRDMLA